LRLTFVALHVQKQVDFRAGEIAERIVAEYFMRAAPSFTFMHYASEKLIFNREQGCKHGWLMQLCRQLSRILIVP